MPLFMRLSIFCAFLISAQTLPAQPLFPGELVPAGNGPNAVAVADLNGDGRLDAVTANVFGSNVSVLLGTGKGTFTLTGTPATGVNPRDIKLADVNADGRLDIVTSNISTGDSVSVLLGFGNGAFQAKRDFATGDEPYSLAIADLNADGRLDIVTGNDAASNVGVLRGNGDGTFQTVAFFAAGSNPRRVRIADVNGDTRPDLVVTNALTSQFSVLLNNGNLQFLAPVTFPLPAASHISDLLLQEVTGDGKPDVLVTGDSHTVDIFAGNGSGGFALAGSYATPNFPSSLVLADFNADGKQDLAVAYGEPNINLGGVAILQGNGSGAFSNRQDATVQFRAVSLAAGDFNSDGRTDVIVAGGSNNNYALPLLGNGDGTLQVPLRLEAGREPQYPVAADVNRDGRPDLLLPDSANNVVTVRIGQGDGTFLPGVNYAVPNSPGMLRVADMDNDGIPDIVTINGPSTNFSMLRGRGDGTFVPRTDFSLNNNFPTRLLLADGNNDGKMDVFITTFQEGILLYPGNGDGTFGARIFLSVSGATRDLAAADVNSDGNTDLILAQPSQLRVAVLRGNGNNTFQTALNYSAGEFCSSLAVADVNGDNAPDILTGCANGKIGVQLNTNGAFGNAILYSYFPVAYNGGYLAVADFDGDSDRDVAVAGIGGNVFMLRNNGSGVFSSPLGYTPVGKFDTEAVADFNGDGKNDLVITQPTNFVTVLLNRIEPKERTALSGPLAFVGIAEQTYPQEVVFTFRPNASGSDFFRIATIYPGENFLLTDIPRAGYTVNIKGRKYLAKNVTADLTGGAVTLSDAVPQLPGDANGDNSVDVLDLDVLIQAFDASWSDGNWNIGADLNSDGSVDVLDLDLLIQYFDNSGDA